MKELLKYTRMADERVIAIFEGVEIELPKAEALFSHVLNAQHIWISRINRNQPDYERFDIQKKEQFAALHRENFVRLEQIIDNVNLESIVEYQNSQGDQFSNTVYDILMHIVNHSTYHRGQIAAQFRLNNIEPPVTDYIFLKREGEF